MPGCDGRASPTCRTSAACGRGSPDSRRAPVPLHSSASGGCLQHGHLPREGQFRRTWQVNRDDCWQDDVARAHGRFLLRMHGERCKRLVLPLSMPVCASQSTRFWARSLNTLQVARCARSGSSILVRSWGLRCPTPSVQPRNPVRGPRSGLLRMPARGRPLGPPGRQARRPRLHGSSSPALPGRPVRGGTGRRGDGETGRRGDGMIRLAC